MASSALNAILSTDGYKLDHFHQYPEGTEYVYSNWTARGTRIAGVDKVIFFGLQHALKLLNESFEAFFAADVDEVCAEYQAFLDSFLGPNSVGTEHIRALHKLGYLPLEIKALPEGTRVPLRVPMLTVENTKPEFFWLTNYLETVLSANLWMPMTSATNAARLRDLINEWVTKTGGDTAGAAFQGHDFAMRGMGGRESSVLSGLGHLVAFTGSDNLPAVLAAQDSYPTSQWIAGGVPATEHSVMCAGGKDDERETYERLLGIYPTGILSVVSDTWDYWNVLTNILPSIKDQIMARDGKLVVRPDSGNPADIICGLNTATEIMNASYKSPAEMKGSIELLWDTFGGTVNKAGYKVLDSHIGLIYGDSMNFERINDICARLESKGFAAENIVFGIGSYSYQYVTRDTFGFAMKATNVVINGEEKAIFKDPKTDSGLKKSMKGRIKVVKNLPNGEIMAVDQSSPDYDELSGDLLETVWKDGKFVKELAFDEVRKNAGF